MSFWWVCPQICVHKYVHTAMYTSLRRQSSRLFTVPLGLLYHVHLCFVNLFLSPHASAWRAKSDLQYCLDHQILITSQLWPPPSSSHPLPLPLTPSLSALFSVVLCHHIDTSHLRGGASTPRYSCTLKPSHPLCHHFQPPLTPPYKYMV